MAKLYFRYGAMGSSKTANAVMVQYNFQNNQKAVKSKQLDSLIFFVKFSLPNSNCKTNLGFRPSSGGGRG